ncbi:shematrin-like protein 2 [Drosophila nasuta]|uniref:shematrin-like protein 2 n=1 Tax=Drosophila nasuta TaxID=42062 RepID=UPI00295EC467|nr:shematrin-like protein 2 [Drosophila nasuta]
MEYAKLTFCLVLCAFVLLCGAEEQQPVAAESIASLADLAIAGETSQADGVEGARKARQFFGPPPPPPFFGPPPPPPPFYGGGFGGFGGGYGGFQRTRVVTRTRYRGGYGGFGGGFYG